MTRKDYIKIAMVINTSWWGSADLKYCFAQNLADEFKLDNPRFDRARFLTLVG